MDKLLYILKNNEILFGNQYMEKVTPPLFDENNIDLNKKDKNKETEEVML